MMNYDISFFLHFVYPPGKPMIPHLLRCQGLAVDYYGFAPGRLGSGASSTFAPLGWELWLDELILSGKARKFGIVPKIEFF
jgi:hypothetical protein